jgi:hypothetical protein
MGSMHLEARQPARPGRRDALGCAALTAAARLDWLVRTRLERHSRRAMVGAGLLTATIAALAYFRGADVHAGLAGGQPALLLPNAVASGARDEQAPGS